MSEEEHERAEKDRADAEEIEARGDETGGETRRGRRSFGGKKVQVTPAKKELRIRNRLFKQTNRKTNKQGNHQEGRHQ